MMMSELTILNAGCEPGALTLKAAEILKSNVRRVLHTGRCPLADWLNENGLAFETLDSLYDAAEDFDGHIGMCEEAVTAMLKEGDVVYCVMSFDDETAKRLASSVPGAQACGNGAVYDPLRLYADGPVIHISAIDAVNGCISSHENVIITEIDSRALACETKLRLMDAFPDEWKIFVKKPDGVIAALPLENLDRLRDYDHRMCALVPMIGDITKAERFDARHLMTIAAMLRDPDNGCPWDKEQTHESLRNSMLEETYEAADAIDNGDTDSLCDELGDMLLHVALHARIAEEYGEFEPRDITTAICKKMIRRHPHIFSDAVFSSIDEINAAWEKIKRDEKKELNTRETLKSAARAMPATMRAGKILWRAEKAGHSFDGYAVSDAESIGRAIFDELIKAHVSGVDAEKALSDAVDAFIDTVE